MAESGQQSVTDGRTVIGEVDHFRGIISLPHMDLKHGQVSGIMVPAPHRQVKIIEIIPDVDPPETQVPVGNNGIEIQDVRAFE